MTATAQSIELLTEDGFRLSGRLWEGEKTTASIGRPMVLIAGATGVPQRFYGRFAAFLAAENISALTFDYRGIGASAPASLRGFDADFLHWARFDLAAALSYCLERGPTAVVGHSFGGHAFGLTQRANETLGLYTFGTGAGWHGYMPWLEQLKVRFLWGIVGPLTTQLLGYLPSRRIGLGENLPLNVYRDWKRWCSYPNYYFGDSTFRYADNVRKVQTPIVAVSAADDLWAPPVSRDAFFDGYENARRKMLTVESTSARPIGHLGYFRSSGAHLWPDVSAWVKGVGAGASSSAGSTT